MEKATGTVDWKPVCLSQRRGRKSGGELSIGVYKNQFFIYSATQELFTCLTECDWVIPLEAAHDERRLLGLQFSTKQTANSIHLRRQKRPHAKGVNLIFSSSALVKHLFGTSALTQAQTTRYPAKKYSDDTLMVYLDRPYSARAKRSMDEKEVASLEQEFGSPSN